MTRIAIAAQFLGSTLFVSVALAQPGTTGGTLAGLGAGAALGANGGQQATTPSSVGGGAGGGGGSSPIEIQIMAFNGLDRVAKEIAVLTNKYMDGCVRGQGRVEGLDALTKQLDDLNKQIADTRKNPDAENANMRKLQQMTAMLAQSSAPKCAILIEDSISANQVGLYRAVQGYADNLERIHAHLQDHFSIQLSGRSMSFSVQMHTEGQAQGVQQQSVSVTNVSSTYNVSLDNLAIEGQDAGFFHLDTTQCLNIAPSQSCALSVTFPSPGSVARVGTFSAYLEIPQGPHNTRHRIFLLGSISPPPPPPPSHNNPPQIGIQLEDLRSQMQFTQSQLASVQEEFAAAQATATGTGTGGTGSSSSATPLDLQYLSGVGTALGVVKNGITYTPSSFQPTTQAFEVLVEAELLNKGIASFTSTSSLNLDEAKDDWTHLFGNLLAWSNDISNWTATCKPSPAPTATSSTASPSSANAACQDAAVITNLAAGQQMITGYTTLLSASNTGSGSPGIVDVLRGEFLSKRMAEGIPSVQVAVASAGGSTRANSMFLLNLFYTPKPSYNAGVIATFELRDGHNELWESGARSVLFDYSKWKPGKFEPNKLAPSDGCGFCEVP